ncbi:MAG: PAS domain S-box protein [Candidatus Omnitrophota bacterium]
MKTFVERDNMKIAQKTVSLLLGAGIIFTVLSAVVVYFIEKNAFLFVFAAVGLFVIIAALITGIYVLKDISGAIRKLHKNTEIISSGKLEYSIAMERSDEIGSLSVVFNGIVKKLRDAEMRIKTLEKESLDHGRTVKELWNKEEYYKRLFDQSNDAVFIYNFEGKMDDVNGKACEILGYKKEDLLRMQFLGLYAEDELNRSREAVQSEAETCSIFYESRFKTADRGVIDVEISSSIVDFKKGIMQAIVRDITERKKLEKELLESEVKFRTFMDTASDLMQIMDKDGKFIYVNDSTIRTLEYSREELLEIKLKDILEGEDRKDFNIKEQELKEKGELECVLVWISNNGKKIHGEMKVSAIYDESGKFSGSRAVFRDISERKKVEESQRLAQLGKFVSDLAHEVRNPIAIITARAQLSLMEQAKTKDKTKNLKIIIEQCEQAQDIIQRTLKFSRPSKGVVTEANINDSMEAIVGLIGNTLMMNDIKIKTEFQKALPLVSIDEKQIQEVFMNLIRNAAEAMPEGGNITIVTSEENGNVRVDCVDEGGGISEEDMENIFDPFFTTKENGTGLGLSVCYGMIKAHGGTLTYKSNPGKGTTATVLLPALTGGNNRKDQTEA